jgi:AcrR family transcriptional regulator
VPRPRQIDRDAVLATGLEVADDVGLDGLTMQAVADRLGVTPMALYRHVANKSDLLDGVVERLLGEIVPPDDELGWDDQLIAIGRAVRGAARRHPAVFPLLLQRPATTPTAKRARERVYAVLRKAGVPEPSVPRVERILSTMVLGFAASEVSGRFHSHSRKVLDADFDAMIELIRAGLPAVVGGAGDRQAAG